MRLSPPSLFVAAVLSTAVGCTVDMAGLGARDAGRLSVVVPDAMSAADGAAAGAPAAGSSGGDASPVAGSGGAGTGGSGEGGAGSVAGSGGGGGAQAGAGGESGTGAAGTGDATDAGLAGQGGSDAVDASGAAGAGGAAGTAGTMGTPDARPISPIGCADGTREGFKAIDNYPGIAACAGGWQVPGFETLTPMCGRSGGNNGTHADGQGCSVADLCAEGWHVCEGINEFSTKAADCKDALPTAGEGGGSVFYGTRQRGSGMMCDATNRDGTNNIHGCGNFGTTAWNTCAPFMRMLRDADCRDNAPWMCVEGPIDYNVKELVDVTKPGASRGGVLCCR